MLNVTVSGSFRRHLTAISNAVQEFTDRGVRVLSPADPRVVAAQGDFVFVASDRVRSVRLVQDRHLASVKESDFLWLVSPDGYVGQSASLELGYAVAHRVSILCETTPHDLTLRQYVRVVPGIAAGVEWARRWPRAETAPSMLLDAQSAIETAHETLDAVKRQLTTPTTVDAASMYAKVRYLSDVLSATAFTNRTRKRAIRKA
jgi:hypothetical protein